MVFHLLVDTKIENCKLSQLLFVAVCTSVVEMFVVFGLLVVKCRMSYLRSEKFVHAACRLLFITNTLIALI